MIKVADIIAGKEKMFLKELVVADTGDGKTHFAATHPKSYFLITEPGGEDTFLTKPELSQNIVGYDKFIPISEDDTKRVFDELDIACNNAREMAKKGEIETVVLDNITYLAANRWIYINRYEPEISRTGEVDVRGMYGKLARWMYNFVLMKLLTIPANLVITVHSKMESEEMMSKKLDKNNPIVPNILGGFRDDIGGMVSLVLYLGKVNLGQGKYKYLARTNMGQGKQGKSRYPNIPEVVENISYQTLKDVILKSINPVKQEEKKGA